jgi:hypothetical protein
MNTAGNKHQEGIQKKSKKVDTFVWRSRTLNSGAQFASTPTNLFAPALYMVPMQGQRVVVCLWDYPHWVWTYSCSYVLRVLCPYRWTAMRWIDFDETFYWDCTLSVIGFHSGWIKFHTFSQMRLIAKKHEINRDVANGVATFIGA